MSILDLLRKPATSAAELRAKLAIVEAELPALESAVVAVEAERSRSLLAADDKAIEAIEARVARARRDRDRVAAAIEELSRQVVETERREANAAIDAIVSSANARAEAVARRLHAAYAKHATALVELLTEVIAADQQVAEARDALKSAGRPADVVKLVEERVPITTNAGLEMSLIRSTSLVPIGEAPGYGAARVQAERLGLVS